MLNKIQTSLLFITLFALYGCNPPSRTSSNPPTTETKTSLSPDTSALNTQSDSSAEHGHKMGDHGGIMVSLGRDSYHIEAVFDDDGAIRLYTLGKDESRVIDVEIQSLQGFVKSEGDAKANSIAFEASPQDGDSKNRTSLFIGKLPAGLVGKNLEVTVPNLSIGGERFRLGFKSVSVAHDPSHDGVGMPDKLAENDEQSVYLVAEGRYTAADIIANGQVTASQKFKGMKSSHDMNPKTGDRICPITQTKANPNFTWIVDGKSYQFCCPPCIDEFVKKAKSSAEPIEDPASYVKK
jgi:hypothetical protein